MIHDAGAIATAAAARIDEWLDAEVQHA